MAPLINVGSRRMGNKTAKKADHKTKLADTAE